MSRKATHNFLTVLSVLALVLAAGCGDDDSPSAPSPPTTGKWSSQNHGMPFRAVWGSSASDVFAVGQNGIIVHYD
jgi:hypothetical protein